MDVAIRMFLAAVAGALGEIPENKIAFTYTITGFDRSPYITRTLLPRLFRRRPLIHRIHRDDADPHPHNHPWEATFLIISGGYDEERLIDGETVKRRLRPGDFNRIDLDTYHRVVNVQPHTTTIGLAGRRAQDWGFLVDGQHVPYRDYFARKKHVALVGGIS